MPKHFVHIRSRLPEALQLQIRQPGHLVLARLACLTRSWATWWGGRKHGVTQTFRHQKLFSGAVDPSQVWAIHQDWRSLSDLQRDTLSRLDGRMISDDGQMVGWDCWGLADLLLRSSFHLPFHVTIPDILHLSVLRMHFMRYSCWMDICKKPFSSNIFRSFSPTQWITPIWACARVWFSWWNSIKHCWTIGALVQNGALFFEKSVHKLRRDARSYETSRNIRNIVN